MDRIISHIMHKSCFNVNPSVFIYTLLNPKLHLKMSAKVIAEHNISSIEVNSVDPDQTAPSSLIRSSLIWVHTVCHRGFLNISAGDKSRRLLLCLSL